MTINILKKGWILKILAFFLLTTPAYADFLYAPKKVMGDFIVKGGITADSVTCSTVSADTVLASAVVGRTDTGDFFTKSADEYVLSLFDEGAGVNWTIGSGNGNIADSTTVTKLGGTSIRFTPDAGDVLRVDKAVDLDLRDYDGFVLHFYVDDVASLDYFDVFFGDTGLANHYKYELSTTSSSGAVQSGWNSISFHKSNMTATTNNPDWSNIDQIRVTVDSNAATTVNFYCDKLSMIKNTATQAIIVFSFDDGNQTIFDNAKPLFDAKGWQATEFVIPGLIGSAGKMDIVDLRTLQDYSGWDIANHTWSHYRMNLLPLYKVYEEFQKSVAYLKENGFHAWDIFAWPYGNWSDDAVEIAKKYCRFARGTNTTYSRTQPSPPGSSRFKTPAFPLSNSMTIAQAKSYVDTAVADKSLLLFYGHDIEAAAGATAWATADLSTLLDYIEDYGTRARVMSFSQYLNQLEIHDSFINSQGDVSARSVTFTTVYFGNWPLVVKDTTTSNVPDDNQIIKFDEATMTFGFEADAGGGGNDVYVEEGDAARADTTGADLYIDFAGGDFNVGVVGNECNVSLAVAPTGTDEDLDGTLENGNVSTRIMNAGGLYFTGQVTGPTVSGNSITTSWGYADKSIGSANLVTGFTVSGGTVRWSGGDLPAGLPVEDNQIMKYDLATNTWNYEDDTGGAGGSEINITFAPQSAKLPGGNPAAIDAGLVMWQLLFDDGDTQETALWQDVLDDDYGGGALYLDIYYAMASGTSDEVEWEASITAISDGDSERFQDAAPDTTNTSVVTVPGTAGYIDKATITLTNKDSIAAGDLFQLRISTDADDGTNDDATGDRILLKAVMRE